MIIEEFRPVFLNTGCRFKQFDSALTEFSQRNQLLCTLQGGCQAAVFQFFYHSV